MLTWRIFNVNLKIKFIKPQFKIKNVWKKTKFEITTPHFVAKLQSKIKKQKLVITWNREQLSNQNLGLTGNSKLSDQILNLSTPYLNVLCMNQLYIAYK